MRAKRAAHALLSALATRLNLRQEPSLIEARAGFEFDVRAAHRTGLSAAWLITANSQGGFAAICHTTDPTVSFDLLQWSKQTQL